MTYFVFRWRAPCKAAKGEGLPFLNILMETSFHFQIIIISFLNLISYLIEMKQSYNDTPL